MLGRALASAMTANKEPASIMAARSSGRQPRTIEKGGRMSGPFIFIATNRLKPGRLEDEKRRVPELCDFIEANEPRLIAFNEYLSEDGTEVGIVQVHPDADSMEFHMGWSASGPSVRTRRPWAAPRASRSTGCPATPSWRFLQAGRYHTMNATASGHMRTAPAGGRRGPFALVAWTF
jgi:hypothetical protein